MTKEPWEKAVEARRVKRAKFRTRQDGYEEIESTGFGTRDTVFVHQLVAIAEGKATPYELFASTNQIHHSNGVPWDNRPSNIEMVSLTKHGKIHDEDEWGEAPWRNADAMREGLKRMSANRLSEVWGCSRRTITNWRKRHGLGKGKPGRKYGKDESTS